MPVMKGRVGENSVDVLRDTGCSGIVVKKDLVSENQFTGDFNVMLLQLQLQLYHRQYSQKSALRKD